MIYQQNAVHFNKKKKKQKKKLIMHVMCDDNLHSDNLQSDNLQSDNLQSDTCHNIITILLEIAFTQNTVNIGNFGSYLIFGYTQHRLQMPKLNHC